MTVYQAILPLPGPAANRFVGQRGAFGRQRRVGPAGHEGPAASQCPASAS